MRDQLSRKTLVPSNRPVHHGRRTIVGRLVVLSVCMLLLGVTSTLAQNTGQDPRCADFNGPAHGLCMAAVANGCFEGAQSPDCDDLTANWTEHCRLCEGQAPWTVPCPCAASGSASELNVLFLGETFDGEPISKRCNATEQSVSVRRIDSADADQVSEIPHLDVTASGALSLCVYQESPAAGPPRVNLAHTGLTAAEVAACRADILLLMRQLTDCP